VAGFEDMWRPPPGGPRLSTTRLWTTCGLPPCDTPRRTATSRDQTPPPIQAASPASNVNIDPRKFLIYKEFVLQNRRILLRPVANLLGCRPPSFRAVPVGA